MFPFAEEIGVFIKGKKKTRPLNPSLFSVLMYICLILAVMFLLLTKYIERTGKTCALAHNGTSHN